MKLRMLALAGAGLLFGAQTDVRATPLTPAVIADRGEQRPTTLAVLVHHKPGHVGGRGRHLGWYKKNRGKKKGWRR